MPRTVEVITFRWYDPVRRRRFTSTYKLELETILERHPEAEVIAKLALEAAR